MKTIAIVLVSSLLVTGSAEAAFTVMADAQEAAAWRTVAESIPLGSKVKVQTYDGKRVSGTLMRVDGTAIMLKRNTRRPEPAVTIAFDELAKLERDKDGGGVHIGKAIAVGVAAGAGAILSLFVIALQLD